MNIKIKQLREGTLLPSRATEGAAGIDLRAHCGDEGIVLQPLERALVPTGIAVELPGPETVALLFARSGLALRHGLAMANGVGVIDSDYRGEVCVPVVNLSGQPLHIARGERIAQLVVVPVCLPGILEVEELTGTQRGAGGFGSTGVE